MEPLSSDAQVMRVLIDTQREASSSASGLRVASHAERSWALAAIAPLYTVIACCHCKQHERREGKASKSSGHTSPTAFMAHRSEDEKGNWAVIVTKFSQDDPTAGLELVKRPVPSPKAGMFV